MLDSLRCILFHTQNPLAYLFSEQAVLAAPLLARGSELPFNALAPLGERVRVRGIVSGGREAASLGLVKSEKGLGETPGEWRRNRAEQAAAGGE